jgi:hypothetical protein
MPMPSEKEISNFFFYQENKQINQINHLIIHKDLKLQQEQS